MNKNYRKNSDALKPIFEGAELVCHDILEAQEKGAAIQGQIGELSDNLFQQCRRLSNDEGLSAAEIFNNLQFMLGYNYKADENGAPDLSGKPYKTEQGAWPKGTLSTYRSVMLAYENRGLGKIGDEPTMKELRAKVNPQKDKDDFMEAIRAMRNNKDMADKDKARIERAMLAVMKHELTAMTKAAKAPAKAKAKAAPKAAPKSHAKKAA